MPTQFKLKVKKKQLLEPVKYNKNFFKILKDNPLKKTKLDLWREFKEKHPSQVIAYAKKVKRIDDIKRKS